MKINEFFSISLQSKVSEATPSPSAATAQIPTEDVHLPQSDSSFTVSSSGGLSSTAAHPLPLVFIEKI